MREVDVTQTSFSLHASAVELNLEIVVIFSVFNENYHPFLRLSGKLICHGTDCWLHLKNTNSWQFCAWNVKSLRFR